MMLKIVPSSTPSTVRQIHPDGVLKEWPQVEPLLERALGEGSYDPSDIARACLSGQWRLWVAERDSEMVGVCITEVVDFPRQRKLLLRYLAGDGEIFDHWAQLEFYALANGCNLIEAYTRKGMARLRPDWTQRYIILQKELT